MRAVKFPETEVWMKNNDGMGESLRTPERCEDGTPSAPKDTLSKQGAMALAKRLEKYWYDRDYPAARFWAEPIKERFAKVGTYEIYRVVCNLVNGLPPRYRDERYPHR
jgi:hypothetical protein